MYQIILNIKKHIYIRKEQKIMNKNDILKDYPDVLNADQVMELLSINRNTLYKLLRNGTIKSIKVGYQWKIPKLYLIQYLYPDVQVF